MFLYTCIYPLLGSGFLHMLQFYVGSFVDLIYSPSLPRSLALFFFSALARGLAKVLPLGFVFRYTDASFFFSLFTGKTLTRWRSRLKQAPAQSAEWVGFINLPTHYTSGSGQSTIPHDEKSTVLGMKLARVAEEQGTTQQKINTFLDTVKEKKTTGKDGNNN